MMSETRPEPAIRAAQVRRLILVAIGGLYLASVPWYRDEAEALTLWFGLPTWVAVALVCYVGVAFLNAVAWMLTDVPDTLDSACEAGNGPVAGSAPAAVDAPPESGLSSTSGETDGGART